MSHYKHCFVIPGLLHLSDADWDDINNDDYPQLNHFINSAKLVETDHKNLDDTLAHQLGLADAIVPLVQHFSKAKNTLIATPINLKIDINSSWIQPTQHSEHINTIINEMALFFTNDVELISTIDGHYVLHFKHCDVSNNLPHYLSVLGKKMDAYQLSIREHLDWFKLVNEMQMFVYGHKLNKNQSGQPMFNSLWFWGGDSQASMTSNKHVTSDDELMQQAFSSQNKTAEGSLAIKTNILKYLKLNNAESIKSFFDLFEKDLAAVNLKEVCINTTDGYQFVYNALSPLKFWKKNQTIKSVLMSVNQY